MRKFQVKFELFGKKYRTIMEAISKEDAIEKAKQNFLRKEFKVIDAGLHGYDALEELDKIWRNVMDKTMQGKYE